VNEPPELVLFDIDGTLIDTGGAGARSWAWAFEQLHGIAADIGQFTDAGMTDPEVARRTFRSAVGHEPSGRELAQVIHLYGSALPDFVQSSPGYRVLDGVRETLDALVDARVVLGITTGAVEAGAHAKLGRAELNRYFTFGGYGSDSTDRTELTLRALHRGERILGQRVDPKRVLVVGDTPRDIEAAHGAGLPGVGVASHHNTREELEAAGAEWVLDSLLEPLPGM